MMTQETGPSGQCLLVLATLTALQLTQGRTAQESALMAAFFTALADGIALISVRQDEEEAP